MSFSEKTKIILSSEYLSLELEETKEDLIPHPEDPIRDLARNYWQVNEVGEPSKTSIPSSHEENRIYLDENRNFYTDFVMDEYVTIFDYDYYEMTDGEWITLMQAGFNY